MPDVAGEHDARHEQHREDDLGVGGDEPAPAGDERLLPSLLRVVHLTQERHLETVDLVTEQRQDGEQERVREQHGRQHAERAADAELGDEVEAEERESRDRDGDGQAGEEHGTARGRAGLGRGVRRRRAPRGGTAETA